MPPLPHPLIDVLSAESFAAEHLPGAVNICEYETAFLGKVRAAFSDPRMALTVYGLNDATLEAAEAASKLRAAGYSNVAILPGGLEAWKNADGKIEGAGRADGGFTGRLQVDSAASFVQWTGRNLLNHHTGTVPLGDGHVTMEEGRLTAAALSIEMASMRCADLTDSALNAALIAHLSSEDFFAVDRHPLAHFSLVTAELVAEATVGSPNYRLRGDLTLRGATHPIEFPAVVAEKAPGVFVAQAILDVDRTLWKALYGSGKFFGRLGPHVVNDLVHLQLKVTTLPLA